MKKIVYSILFIILLMGLLLNVFSLAGTSLFGFRIYQVGSGSMEPFLKVNDKIIIKESDANAILEIVIKALITKEEK